MAFENLTDETFLLYAAKHYDNSGCLTVTEFYDDLKRIKYIKRLLNKYHVSHNIRDLKERLILNHIITLYNVFGPVATTRLLFLKLDGYYEYLKPFLILLNYMPDVVLGINNKNIHSSNIVIDSQIVCILRKV